MNGTGGNLLRTMCITVLGSGFAPFASGSWGSLTSLLIYVAIVLALRSLGLSQAVIEIGTIAGILAACLLSVIWGEWAIERFGSKDPKPFVLDEFAGQWTTMLFMPVVIGLTANSCLFLGVQLFLFRLMDVIKPPPARQLERLHAGWGVLLDDVMAGIYANLLGQMIWRLSPMAGWLQS